jgi:hypothetical protein
MILRDEPILDLAHIFSLALALASR